MKLEDWHAYAESAPLTPDQRGAILGHCDRLDLVDRAERLAVLAELSRERAEKHRPRTTERRAAAALYAVLADARASGGARRALVSPGRAARRNRSAGPVAGGLVPGGVPGRSISVRRRDRHAGDLRGRYQPVAGVRVNLGMPAVNLGAAGADLGVDLGVVWGGSGE